MYRKLIALVAVAALATAGQAAPARADTDLAKFLAGFAALAIIGSAINDHQQRDPVVVHRKQVIKPQVVAPRKVTPRPLPPAVSRHNLPAECIRVHQVNNRNLRLLGARCLRQNYRHSGALPQACQYQFTERGRTRTGYEPVCLRQRGFRIAGR